jgi:hypothetical protein
MCHYGPGYLTGHLLWLPKREVTMAGVKAKPERADGKAKTRTGMNSLNRYGSPG